MAGTLYRKLQDSFALSVAETYDLQAGEDIFRTGMAQSMDRSGSEALEVLLDGMAVGEDVMTVKQAGYRTLNLLYVRQICHSRWVDLAIRKALEAPHLDTAAGRSSRHTLKSETVTSMSPSTAFGLSNFSSLLPGSGKAGRCSRPGSLVPLGKNVLPAAIFRTFSHQNSRSTGIKPAVFVKNDS